MVRSPEATGRRSPAAQRLRSALAAVFALALLGLTSVAWANDPAPAASGATSAGARSEVKLRDTSVFELKAGLGHEPAQSRAERATKALNRAWEDPKADDVRSELQGGLPTVFVGDVPIVQLGPDDAVAAGDATLDVFAANTVSKVRAAVRAERRRSAVAKSVFSVSLVVLTVLAGLYALRKIGELVDRARDWVNEHPDRMPRISLQAIEVVRPASLRSAVLVGLGIAKMIAQLAVLWAGLLFGLSLFESTRGTGQRLSGALLEPITALLGRAATSLPVILVVTLGVLAVAMLLRFLALFFESVARGENDVAWLPSDLARPTSVLIRFGVVLAALVFAAPVVTGDPDGALARGGYAALVALGLGAVPVLANGVVGAVFVYGRRLRVGQRATIGPHAGRVRHAGLVDFEIELPSGSVARVPYLFALSHPLIHGGARDRVSVIVCVKRSTLGAEARAAWLKELEAVGETPRLELIELDDEHARLSVSVASDDNDALARLTAALCDRGVGG